jgi:hypothetical protein
MELYCVNSGFTQPVVYFAQPVCYFTQPVGDVAQPVGDFTQPVGDFTQPVGDFTQPVGVFTNSVRSRTDPLAVQGLGEVAVDPVEKVQTTVPPVHRENKTTG